MLILIEHFLIEAHPRSRGEKLGDDALSATPTGASPLMRENPQSFLAKIAVIGSSPLTRGKTKREERGPLPGRAHPRSRGENFAAVWGTLRDWGSSPLTRGKQAASRDCCVAARLIPAHAGKTLPRCGTACGSSAHPRSRGENSCRPDSWHTRGGSSPLMRGKLLDCP